MTDYPSNLSMLFVGSFVFTYLVIPVLRQIIIKQDVFNSPTERDLHKTKIPKLIGIAFYFCIVLCSIFLFQAQSDSRLIVLMTALTIILYVGVRDDIYVMSAWGKIILQLLSISVIVFSNNLFLDDFFGLFGIHKFPILFAIPLTFFVGIFMINSFNLIDGIDGLAGMLALLMFMSFGYIFALSQDKFIVTLLVILSGSILAFLRFNLSVSRKVFMGDTGSQLIGFVIFYLTLLLIKSENITRIPAFHEHAQLRIIACILIFIVPVIDSGSIFLVRILNNKSPFSPDNSHLHHIVLKRFKNHKKSSLIILCFNFFSLLIFSIIYYNASFLVFSTSTFLYLLLCIILIIRYHHRKTGNIQ